MAEESKPKAQAATGALGALKDREPVARECGAGAEPMCLADFEALAKAKMPATSWEYVTAGAGDEITVRWNIEAYQRIRLRPRILVDVSKVDTRVTLLGQ